MLIYSLHSSPIRFNIYSVIYAKAPDEVVLPLQFQLLPGAASLSYIMLHNAREDGWVFHVTPHKIYIQISLPF